MKQYKKGDAALANGYGLPKCVMPEWWNGRRAWLKPRYPRGCASSSLALGTINHGVAGSNPAGVANFVDFVWILQHEVK